MHCTYFIEETKELSLSLYSDSMGVNIGERPSLHVYSDKHGDVKVKILFRHLRRTDQRMVLRAKRGGPGLYCRLLY